jgi:hypothetical protein
MYTVLLVIARSPRETSPKYAEACSYIKNFTLEPFNRTHVITSAIDRFILKFPWSTSRLRCSRRIVTAEKLFSNPHDPLRKAG